MYKRISIRIVQKLADELLVIAKERGLSVNALISEMAWAFVDDWKKKYIVSESDTGR
jgi:predicted HicB family RNase H-like nuclease